LSISTVSGADVIKESVKKVWVGQWSYSIAVRETGAIVKRLTSSTPFLKPALASLSVSSGEEDHRSATGSGKSLDPDPIRIVYDR
jgi:hypothetical protein